MFFPPRAYPNHVSPPPHWRLARAPHPPPAGGYHISAVDYVFVALQSLGRVADPETPVRFSIFRTARRRPCRFYFIRIREVFASDRYPSAPWKLSVFDLSTVQLVVGVLPTAVVATTFLRDGRRTSRQYVCRATDFGRHSVSVVFFRVFFRFVFENQS